tara:strand:+ start:446 stop:853 length:408 start_codon:yes stop_codon:yes gene_type:complete
MKKYTIYKIEFPDGSSYIGQTRNHEMIRWGQHLNDVQQNRHGNPRIQSVYDEYGYDDWVFEIIEQVVSDDSSYVCLLEQHYIKKTPNTLNRASRLPGNEIKRRCNVNAKSWYHERGGKEKFQARQALKKQQKLLS